MPWDTSELAGLAEALAEQSPFAPAAKGGLEVFATGEDPLAASAAFAARVFPGAERETVEAFATGTELETEEDEEVVDALPGHALEERLRGIGDETETLESFTGESFAAESLGGESGALGAECESPYETADETVEREEEKPSIGERLGGLALGARATAAIVLGERDEGKLTDMVFHARHPELPAGTVVDDKDPKFGREAKRIRETVIRPALRAVREGIIFTPPFAGPYDPNFSPDAALETCLAAAVPGALRVALVDVTDPTAPAYAGVDDEKTTFAASLAKVIPLFAAFELRARVTDAVRSVPTTTPVATVRRNIERAWRPKMDATLPKVRGVARDFPRLAEILEIKVVGGAWKVDFTSKGDIATLADAEDAGFAKIDGKFGFREMLRLMASFSNNQAAARVITALGYEYIHGAVLTAGMWDAAKGGLWIGAPYSRPPEGTRTWLPAPSMTGTNRSRHFQVGSAKTFARLFTLLAQRKLVDQASSDDMLDMLVPQTSDFFHDALDTLGRGVNSMATKIGVIDGSYWAQTSLVRRDLKDAGKRVQYVLSILNNDAPFALDDTTIKPIDDCILTRHPGAAP